MDAGPERLVWLQVAHATMRLMVESATQARVFDLEVLTGELRRKLLLGHVDKLGLIIYKLERGFDLTEEERLTCEQWTEAATSLVKVEVVGGVLRNRK